MLFVDALMKPLANPSLAVYFILKVVSVRHSSFFQHLPVGGSRTKACAGQGLPVLQQFQASIASNTISNQLHEDS